MQAFVWCYEIGSSRISGLMLSFDPKVWIIKQRLDGTSSCNYVSRITKILMIQWRYCGGECCSCVGYVILPCTGISLNVTTTLWMSAVRGQNVTLNLAPPRGSTLVGMLIPEPAVTRISRLPSPAWPASTTEISRVISTLDKLDSLTSLTCHRGSDNCNHLPLSSHHPVSACLAACKLLYWILSIFFLGKNSVIMIGIIKQLINIRIAEEGN